MKYIIAHVVTLLGKTRCSLDARRQSTDGRVLINENDLKNIPGTIEEKVISINGQLLSETEAIAETNKEEWL